MGKLSDTLNLRLGDCRVRPWKLPLTDWRSSDHHVLNIVEGSAGGSTLLGSFFKVLLLWLVSEFHMSGEEQYFVKGLDIKFEPGRSRREALRSTSYN